MNDLWARSANFYEGHDVLIGILGGASLLVFIGTLIAIPLALAWLPKDILHRKHLLFRDWPPYFFIPYLILKNLLGILFLLSGLAMLILPGQGLLTLFVGLLLLNFPRKRALIRRILGNEFIFNKINKLRVKFGKPGLDPA